MKKKLVKDNIYALRVNGVIKHENCEDMNLLAYDFYMYDECYSQEGDEVSVVCQYKGNSSWIPIKNPPIEYDKKLPIFLFKNGAIYYSDNNKRCFFGGHIQVDKDMFHYKLTNGWGQRVYLSMDAHFIVDVTDTNTYKKTRNRWFSKGLYPWAYINYLKKENEK